MSAKDEPGRAEHRDSWSENLQFIWDLLGDPVRLRRLRAVIKQLVAVAVLLAVVVLVVVGAIAGAYYVITQHAPIWARFGILPSATALITGAGALFRHFRKKRRAARLARKRTAKTLPEKTPQQQDGALGGPRGRQREDGSDADPDPDPRSA
jgi:Ni/Fe-hydrogenase subunit HybB-like protein